MRREGEAETVETYRIVNFIIQSAYLIGHMVFIVALYRRRQPTPVWGWFFALSVALWAWVAGRFMETVVYLFRPTDNGAYVFAANFQYIGDTLSVACYVMWVLSLTGMDRLASNGWFRALLFGVPAAICLVVFTNAGHHLFYTKLVMGQRVAHGPLFLPSMAIMYLFLMMGYVISLRFVLRSGRERARQIVMFSLFPLLPAIGILVRSISGVDKLDYTPMVMAVAILSFYQIIFRRQYVNIVSASIRSVMEQTAHPIGIYDPSLGRMTYANRVAREKHRWGEGGFIALMDGGAPIRAGEYARGHLALRITPLAGEAGMLVTATDTERIDRQREALEAQIRSQEALQSELEASGRDIDAYIDALPGQEDLAPRQALIDAAYAAIDQTLTRVEENFVQAKRSPERAAVLLEENLDLTREGIGAIRRAVGQLRGVDHGNP